MTISIETQGRRHYIRGNTFPIKDALRAAGFKWDGDAKAWWTGKLEVAAKFTESKPAQAESQPSSEASSGGLDTIVAGRATYKGQTFYSVGRKVRGRTHWDDTVSAVSTSDGAKVLLVFRDGSKTFWAARSEVQIVATYERPKTLQSLADYAKKAKTFGSEECACRCHREPNAGKPGSTLYDGCDRCGCEAC